MPSHLSCGDRPIPLFICMLGVFAFKAYTNGHPYDTSQVWLQFFSLLLDQEDSSPSLVPALVVSQGYPNPRTWEALRRLHSTEMTGSLLTCRLDFSPEWRTYYDYRSGLTSQGGLTMTTGLGLLVREDLL